MNIWKDEYFTVSTSDPYYEYEFYIGYDLIWQGVAENVSGTQVRIYINDIAAQYLHQALPSLAYDQAVTTGTALAVTIKLTHQGIYVDQKTVAYDWSYDAAWDVFTDGGSEPVTGVLDRRQALVFTPYASGSVTLTFTNKDASTFTQSYTCTYDTNIVVPLSQVAMEHVAGISCGGSVWRVEDTCARYAVYYVNAHGGWDSVVMKGAASVSDTVARSTDGVADGSRVIKTARVNAVEKNVTLHTGLLSDTEAARMHHLVESVSVWLCDLDTMDVQQAVVTGTSCEYPTRAASGKPVNYKVTLQLAANRYRM